MKSLIITGPESTGKSTIAEYLSNALNIELIKEYSRFYLTEREGIYEFDDLQLMAQKAYSIIDEKKDLNLILDTDILSYKIWSEVKYQKTSHWIDEKMSCLSHNLYLLCYPDIQWVEDPLRESQHERHELFKKYEQKLIQYNASYFIICGSKKVRLQTALDLATNYFQF